MAGNRERQNIRMFSPEGLIVSPNSPRVSQPNAAPYGTRNTPKVEYGKLAPRNKQYYNIGAPTGAAEGGELDLACHHVVGWDIIWGFWNALITHKEYLVARCYLALFGAAQATTSKMEDQIKNKRFTAGADWEAQLCWKPNNIVRGPRDRSDDPNTESGLENKIDFQKARADLYKGRVSGLVGAGRQMAAYIDRGEIEKAKGAIQYFKSIQNEEIMEWDESTWAVDSQFPSFSQTKATAGGLTVVKPKWRIHIAKR